MRYAVIRDFGKRNICRLAAVAQLSMSFALQAAAEEEGLYHPATAVIAGCTIVLTSPEVKHPRLVRYGWQPFTRANLVNGASLPASTFRGEVGAHD